MVESVTIQTENKGPSLEDEAAAQEAASKATEPKLAGEEDTPERPEWLPEKFKSPEDLAKAYAELEKAKGKGKEAEAAEDAEKTAEEAVESAGLDMDALSAEYEENGELTEESYEALAKVGITKEMVETFIAGQEAKVSGVRSELLESVGGDEGYNEMISWAAENLSEAEIDAFNSVLEGGDFNATKMAVENLGAKYTRANGSEPARQLGGKASSGTGGVYESTADLMKDMQNPEYAKNPAFRAKVEAKLGRSNIL